jgi:predicted deacylase
MIRSGSSSVWTDLDLSKSGKQVGRLHLPYSVTRSAYGHIDIPLAIIKNGSGPTVLLMAGNHGDEYEGQVTMIRLIQDR